MSFEFSRRLLLSAVAAGGLAIATAIPSQACIFSQGKGSTAGLTGDSSPSLLAKFDWGKSPASLVALLGLGGAGVVGAGCLARSRARRVAASDRDPLAAESFPIPVYLESPASEAAAAEEQALK